MSKSACIYILLVAKEDGYVNFQVGFVVDYIIGGGNHSVGFGDSLYHVSFKKYIGDRKILQLVSVSFFIIICMHLTICTTSAIIDMYPGTFIKQ